MPPSLLAWFALAVIAAAAVALAVESVSRRLRPCRVARAAGTAVVSPQRAPASGETAALSASPTMPFAYDNGLISEEGGR
jgi:hypothetical protein